MSSASSDEETPIKYNISTRGRRANAGSRIDQLIELQEPLAEEDEIFQEVENDEEFELPPSSPEEESEDDNDSDGDKHIGDGAAGSGPEAEADGAADVETRATARAAGDAGEDDNFSDSSDSSVENDEEAADAGEKELVRQQREEQRERKRAERRKMFHIKEHKRPPPRDGEVASSRLAKRRAIPVVVNDSERRVSTRESALRMKQHLFERLKENERRRSGYVAPTPRVKHKLTQEERLAEAEITERKNTASLRRFINIEEHKKQQRRLTLISRRPRLTQFVRWQSATLLQYPELEKEFDPKDVKKEDDGDEEIEAEEPQEAESVPPETPISEELAVAEGDASRVATDAAASAESEAPALVSDHGTPDAEAVKSEDILRLEPPQPLIEELPSEPEEDEEEEEPVIREVEGPAHAANVSILTLHEFHEPINNRYAVKRAVLGSLATRQYAPPLKRLCPLSGVEARYIDPQTGVAYYSIENYKNMKKIRGQSLVWNIELGGVYLAPREGQRHAKGVPPGFAKDAVKEEDKELSQGEPKTAAAAESKADDPPKLADSAQISFK